MKLTGNPGGARQPIATVAMLDLLLFGGLRHLLDSEEAPAEPIATDPRRFRLIREVQQEVMTALWGADLCHGMRMLDDDPIHTWDQVEWMACTEVPRFLADLGSHPHEDASLAAALVTSFVHTMRLTIAHGPNGTTWRGVTKSADRTVKLARAIGDGSLARVLTG
ncbi:hypothetical protein [Dactylosporangium sp. CA-139066]|uniref:hypothetical protein n=1 Tax=Dactylosporangium sp. CA-139066 TaxID=3239930 RepID=UPI003D8A9527